MAYLKQMFDEREIAHLSEDGQYLCANEGVLQYNLPLNLFIGNRRKVSLVDVVVWAKKRIFPRNRMEDPFWLRFSEDETFEDTTRGRARKIMAEYQKLIDTN